ncbi:hypothetical protein B0H17DRAFT_1198257 [Mycena rosella]|uniref:Uncharacterized protein n=1 Tax=Mycena rosella TaxID=1033263 RepID=A0AAD7DP61_MYCRO|nr:hypothetical protein B0H17DRAFT_1198257 [Mycena rosella]
MSTPSLVAFAAVIKGLRQDSLLIESYFASHRNVRALGPAASADNLYSVLASSSSAADPALPADGVFVAPSQSTLSDPPPPTVFSHHALLAPDVLSTLDSLSLISLVTQLSDRLNVLEEQTLLGMQHPERILPADLLYYCYHAVFCAHLQLSLAVYILVCRMKNLSAEDALSDAALTVLGDAQLDVRHALASLVGQFDGCIAAQPLGFTRQRELSESGV